MPHNWRDIKVLESKNVLNRSVEKVISTCDCGKTFTRYFEDSELVKETEEEVKIFSISMRNLGELTMNITLPEGKTQFEILQQAKEEIKKVEKALHGKHIYINGRITTSLCLFLGHYLAHICKSVSIFDPKENKYVLCIEH